MLQAAPVDYGTASSPRPGPPAIIAVIGVCSIVIAIASISFSVWYAAQTYYTRTLKPPPARAATYVPKPEPTPRRVTLEEGQAIIDGIARVVPITAKQRETMKSLLIRADDAEIAVVTDPSPTPESIAANASGSGKLFGEEGYWIVIGDVRVELSDDHGMMASAKLRTPRINFNGNSSSYTHGRPDVLSFEKPVPPPVKTPPPPPAPSQMTLAQATPLIAQYGSALAGFAAAVLLLIAGIASLRYSRSARLLHLLWAWLKLPLAVAASAAYFFILLDGNLTIARGVTPWTNAVLQHPALFAPLLAAVYAIAVLIVMYLPGVRRYFAQSPARSE